MSSKPDSGPGTNVVAAVRRIGTSGPKRRAARTACDELLVELAVATVGQGNWTVRHASGAAPTLFRDGQPSRASISVAHSAHWIAAGIAINASIGVDIQLHKDQARARRIADLLKLPVPNSGDSHPNVESKQADSQHHEGLFFDAWVLRESIAKATGGSLLLPHASEIELTAAFGSRGNIVRVEGFEALVERVDPKVSFAAVIQHHRTMRRCA